VSQFSQFKYLTVIETVIQSRTQGSSLNIELLHNTSTLELTSNTPLDLQTLFYQFINSAYSQQFINQFILKNFLSCSSEF